MPSVEPSRSFVQVVPTACFEHKTSSRTSNHRTPNYRAIRYCTILLQIRSEKTIAYHAIPRLTQIRFSATSRTFNELCASEQMPTARLEFKASSHQSYSPLHRTEHQCNVTQYHAMFYHTIPHLPTEFGSCVKVEVAVLGSPS